MSYSDDEDLVPIYYPSASALPTLLAPLHEEAGRQIDADMVAGGTVASTDLDDLSEDTLDALVKPACCYVMYLICRGGLSHDREGLILTQAKFWLGEYKAAIAAVPVGVGTSTETTATNDRVWMG